MIARVPLHAAAIALLALATAGCVERRLIIESEPPGARVWVNDREVGRTPVETTFLFHGVYDVRMEAEGFEPLSTSAEAVAPWWEYPPIDFLAEAAPFRIWNTQRWSFELEPSLESRLDRRELEEGLLDRAGQMRIQTREQTGE